LEAINVCSHLIPVLDEPKNAPAAVQLMAADEGTNLDGISLRWALLSEEWPEYFTKPKTEVACPHMHEELLPHFQVLTAKRDTVGPAYLQETGESEPVAMHHTSAHKHLPCNDVLQHREEIQKKHTLGCLIIRALDLSWMCEPMFDGSAYPKI
jgi:hypothetical protein